MALRLTQPLRLLLPLPQIVGEGLPKVGVGEVDDHLVPLPLLRPLLGPLPRNHLDEVQLSRRQTRPLLGGLPVPSAGGLRAEAKIDDLGSVRLLLLGRLEEREVDALLGGDGLADVYVDDCFLVAQQQLLGLDVQGLCVGMGRRLALLFDLLPCAVFSLVLSSPILLMAHPCPHPTLLHRPILPPLDHLQQVTRLRGR
jgi:hypothetical protein